MPYEPLDLSFLSFLMTPKMEAAIEEMKHLIAAKYPDAIFEVDYGEQPLGVHLYATFEHDDLGEVLDHYIDRLVDFQVDEGLRLYVFPMQPTAQDREIGKREHDRENTLRAAS